MIGRHILIKRTVRTVVFIALPLLMITAAGCAKKTPPPPPPPPKVTVAQPVRQTVNDHLELIGNTQAVNTVQLVARVSGYLDQVFFHDGQLVKKDQPLFRIQRDTYEAKLKQAEGQVLAQKALFAYAQNELNRFTELQTQKAAAQTDVDNWHYQRDSAEANLKVAEANRDLAKLDLSYTTVVAPYDGRVDRRQQDPGNLVGANGNTVLAQLTQLDPVYVYFSISDFDLVRLLDSMKGLPDSSGDEKWPVWISLVNEDGYRHKGTIDFAASNLSSSTGTLLMRGVFDNPDGKILPGSFAKVMIPLKDERALLVPEIAVVNDQQGSYVLVVGENNLVDRRNVVPGFSVDNLRVILHGLDGSEWVIVNGIQRAFPGRPVSPEKETPSAGGSPTVPKETQVKP